MQYNNMQWLSFQAIKSMPDHIILLIQNAYAHFGLVH